MKKNPRFFCSLLPFFFSVVASAQMPLPDSTEGDFKIANFPFQSGETTLPALTVHYTTFGKPVKDADGKTTNAILIMHGTTGNGASTPTTSSTPSTPPAITTPPPICQK